jgi:cell wall-associated NlpC family hydrolase
LPLLTQVIIEGAIVEVITVSELTQLISDDPTVELMFGANVNLYDSSNLERLATQAIAGRRCRILSSPSELSSSTPTADGAIRVQLCEDAYPGWIAVEDCDVLDKATTPYQPALVSEADIGDRLPRVISYAHRAMQQHNHYLWGGTVGPHYDCSGLMQAAFLSVGLWIPRDAYQQEAFAQPISLDNARPGDLVFFGTPDRTTHVGLYLGDRRYIHSSGKDIGRNGIGIDDLSADGDTVSQNYFHQFKSVGRITTTYLGNT